MLQTFNTSIHTFNTPIHNCSLSPHQSILTFPYTLQPVAITAHSIHVQFSTTILYYRYVVAVAAASCTDSQRLVEMFYSSLKNPFTNVSISIVISTPSALTCGVLRDTVSQLQFGFRLRCLTLGALQFYSIRGSDFLNSRLKLLEVLAHSAKVAPLGTPKLTLSLNSGLIPSFN